jgi:EEF1A N-terminal glycine/lysine methyltransferase
MYTVDAYGKVLGKLGRHDVIVLADCLWIPSQHANLVKTIARALDDWLDCCAIIVAGFHTGRGIVRDFFDLATGGADGEGVNRDTEASSTSMAETVSEQWLPRLKIEEIYEVDVNGQRRQWQKARPGEGKEESKKWCVVAILVPP